MGSEEHASSAAGASRPIGPRVLHVVPTALGRGAQIFARALVDELGGPNNGHRLVSLFESHPDVNVDNAFGLHGGANAAKGLRPRAVAQLSAALKAIEYDVVVAHGGDAYKYMALVSKAPIVYCIIGTWPVTGPKRIQRLLWRFLIRRAWVAAAVSDDVATDCREVLAIRDDRLVVLPNGRDPLRYRPARHDTPERTPTENLTLLFIGHLDAGKRPDRFVDLIGALRERGFPVTGKIVGDGPMRSALNGPAAAAGVELLGKCSDVVPHLQQADLLVFPSAPDGEGMPGVLIEAGLCGIPAVATRVAGASTVIEQDKTGILVPVDDFDSLLQAAVEMVTRPELRLAMGANARTRCERSFSLSVVAGEWDKLLRSVPIRSPGHRTLCKRSVARTVATSD